MRLQQYRLFQHHGTFYVENVGTKKQESLRTKSRPEALVLLAAKNEAARQPALNLQIARTYLAASDPLMPKRTWQHVLDEIIKTKTGETQYRWINVAKDKAMIPLLNQKLPVTPFRRFKEVCCQIAAWLYRKSVFINLSKLKTWRWLRVYRTTDSPWGNRPLERLNGLAEKKMGQLEQVFFFKERINIAPGYVR